MEQVPSTDMRNHRKKIIILCTLDKEIALITHLESLDDQSHTDMHTLQLLMLITSNYNAHPIVTPISYSSENFVSQTPITYLKE